MRGDDADDVFDQYPAARTLRAATESAAIADIGPGLDPVRDGTDSFGANHEVPFGALVRVLRTPSDAGHGPPVQLTGAWITGSPVLDHGTVTRPLRLVRCVIDTPIRLTGVAVSAVELVDCVFATITVEDADFAGSIQVTGCRGDSVRITNSRTSRSVVFAGTELTGAAPLDIRNLRISGDFNLEGARLGTPSPGESTVPTAPPTSTAIAGAVPTGIQAHGLEVSGALLLPDTHVVGGIDLRSATIDSGVFMAGAEVLGPTDLRGATVGGPVDVSRCRIAGDNELAAFSGDHLSAAAFFAQDVIADGAIVLRQATIRGSVTISDARIAAGERQSTDRSFTRRSALVLADIVAGRIAIADCEIDGGVWLPGADLRDLVLRRLDCSGPLNCEGGSVAAGVRLEGSTFAADADRDPRAVSAGRVRVGGRIVFGPDFTAEGHIDLAHADIGKSIDLTGSRLRGRLRLFRAHAGSDLMLVGTVVEAGHKEFGIDAIGLRVDGRLTARGLVCDGSVRLTAVTADHVVFTGAQIYQPGKVALLAARIEVYGDVVLGDSLDSAESGGLEVDGRVLLRDAHVGGDLVLNEARLRNPGHRVVDTTGASVGGRLIMRNLDARGMVSIDRTRVRRRIVLESSVLDGRGVSAARGSTSFTALSATTDELLVDECRFYGSFRLNGSDIAVGVSIRSSTLSAAGDGERLALHADDLRCARFGLAQLDVDGTFQATRLQTGGDVEITDSAFRCSGRRAIDLAGAVVGERLEIRRTAVRGSVSAVRTEVGVGVDLNEVEVAVHGAERGRDGSDESVEPPPALGFRNVQVQGELTTSEVRLHGEMVLAEASFESVHVDATTSVLQGRTGGAVAEAGSGNAHDRWARDPEPTMVLDAHELAVSGTVDLNGFGVESTDGIQAVVDLSGLEASTLDVPGGKVIVDLRGARVRTLAIDGDDTAHMILEGLEFDDPGRADVKTALAWLHRDPTGFHHQAYEQLAGYYERKGDNGSARTVRLARQRHRNELLGTRSRQLLAKVWGWIQDVTVGYGYRPGLAAVWFGGMLAFGTVWFWGSSIDPVEAKVHPTFNAFGYSLDLLIPVFSFGQDSAWDPRGADLVVSYGLIFAGAILATTILAAVTRVLNPR